MKNNNNKKFIGKDTLFYDNLEKKHENKKNLEELKMIRNLLKNELVENIYNSLDEIISLTNEDYFESDIVDKKLETVNKLLNFNDEDVVRFYLINKKLEEIKDILKKHNKILKRELD